MVEIKSALQADRSLESQADTARYAVRESASPPSCDRYRDRKISLVNTSATIVFNP